jgi:hypothetical protein
MNAQSAPNPEKDQRIPPRERLLAIAADLFYRHGIRAVGVEAIAEAAGTNKMTLYRHFASKDELVAEYLRQSAKGADACWNRFEQAHPGDPLAQLRAWLKEMAAHVANTDERGGSAGLGEPEMLADELHLLLEGARVTAQSVGSNGLDARLIRMGEAMIAAHSKH